MAGLETQVGKIYISNRKLSKSFVSLFSEKLPESNAEIFVLVEIALLNPAAWIEHEKIAKQIASSLKKYFRASNPNSFENAIAAINDQLGHHAEMGQTAWVGKMNACLAVKQDSSLYITTTGKIHAYLFRDKQFSDIGDNSANKNPLKTFENFSIGKVQKRDLLIFTTPELFNYLSLERIKKTLSDLPIGAACQSIAEIVKETADDSISFGTFVLELGIAEEISKENEIKISGILEQPSLIQRLSNLAEPIKDFAAHTILISKKAGIPKINLSRINTQSLKQQAKQYTDIKKLRELPRSKKFFLIATVVFVLLLVIDLIVATSMHFQTQNTAQLNTKLASIQNEINDANTAYIYKDLAKANALVASATSDLQKLPNNNSVSISKQKLQTEVNDLIDSLGNIHHVGATKITSYDTSNINHIGIFGNHLYLVNTSGNLFVPYNFTTKALEHDFTINTPAIQNLAFGSLVVGTDGSGNLYQLDLVKQTYSTLPGQFSMNTLGLKIIGSPAKIYTLDKNAGQLLSTPISAASITKQNLPLANAIDFASDGSAIYVLNMDGVKKYVSGQTRTFGNLGMNFGSNAKIYVGSSVYILDPSSKRLIITDRSGNTINQFTSTGFGNLKDVVIDETHKAAYILSDNDVYTISIK